MRANPPGGRLDETRLAIAEYGVDGLIVSHLPNIRYLTGFSGTSAVLVVEAGAATLYTDSRYREQAGVEVGDRATVVIAERNAWEGVRRHVSELPELSSIGFEASSLTVSDLSRLEQCEGVRVEPTTDLIERLRLTKDANEVASIADAAAMASEALRAALETVEVGQTEQAVAAKLERELRLRGSEWHPFPTIAASGPRSALPHAGTTDRTIERGDWLLLDFGARANGYCADITRTVVVGADPDDRQRRVYDLVREAQRHAIEGMRPGMSGRGIDALARAVIADGGYGADFGHSLGHGLGLEVHEKPILGPSNEDAIPEHAVVTVEPGIYLPGWGGVRIEDDVRVGADGASLLSDGATELRVVGGRL